MCVCVFMYVCVCVPVWVRLDHISLGKIITPQRGARTWGFRVCAGGGVVIILVAFEFPVFLNEA